MSDSVLLPFNVVAYTSQLELHLKEFETAYKSLLDEKQVSLAVVFDRLSALQQQARIFLAISWIP